MTVLLRTLIATLAVLSSIVTIFVFVSGLPSLGEVLEHPPTEATVRTAKAAWHVVASSKPEGTDGFFSGLLDGVLSLPRALFVWRFPPYDGDNTGWFFYKVGVIIGAIVSSTTGGITSGALWMLACGAVIRMGFKIDDGDKSIMVYLGIMVVPIISGLSWFILVIGNLIV